MIGDPGKPLASNRYVYIISYRCTRLVQFLPFSEDFTWNATGYWPIPLERVTVSLDFARAPRPGFNEWSATVGSPDQNAEDWFSTLLDENWLEFQSTRPLEVGEAMTISASWPRGYSFAPPSQGRILDLDIQATLGSNHHLTVQEQITLYNDGRYNDGFSRYFPLLYSDGDGNRKISRLDIEQVLMNGQVIPWELKKFPDGQRIVVGGEEDSLPQGKCILVLRYSLNRQVLLGTDLEQLRWQVPGYPFDEGIDQVRFSLVLPNEIPKDKLMIAAFTRSGGGGGQRCFPLYRRRRQDCLCHHPFAGAGGEHVQFCGLAKGVSCTSNMATAI